MRKGSVTAGPIRYMYNTNQPAQVRLQNLASDLGYITINGAKLVEVTNNKGTDRSA